MIVDLFAGGGGASTGIEAALGRAVDLAIDHSPVALAVHRANHAGTTHLEANVWDVRPGAATRGAPVELLWASPDCTHFSAAKGDVPRSAGIRSLAWVVVRWARAVRPSVILLENVREFMGWGPLGADGRPIKRRAGETFAAWVRAFERLGYRVEWRVLDAAAYGAPTRRRRLFVVARCDGLPIQWPEPSHGPGLAPWRTAAECIDWSIPCRSIFERARPLAPKTLWRIAEGIRRYVLEAPAPFVVEPLGTVTTQSNRLFAPTLVQTGYGEDRHRNGGRGQNARVPGLDKPLGTLVAGGCKHALVAAFLAKHFGGVVGHELGRPIGTVTGRDHHALAAATLLKLEGACHGQDLREPAPTICAGGMHVAEVRAFLTCYYGSGSTGQTLSSPARTITAKHRLGLVKVEGLDCQIVDVGMRMLQPHELLRAQFGPYAKGYDMTAARTKEAQIRLIGNSVCPQIAAALVRSNLLPAAQAVG